MPLRLSARATERMKLTLTEIRKTAGKAGLREMIRNLDMLNLRCQVSL